MSQAVESVDTAPNSPSSFDGTCKTQEDTQGSKRRLSEIVESELDHHDEIIDDDNIHDGVCTQPKRLLTSEHLSLQASSTSDSSLLPVIDKDPEPAELEYLYPDSQDPDEIPIVPQSPIPQSPKEIPQDMSILEMLKEEELVTHQEADDEAEGLELSRSGSTASTTMNILMSSRPESRHDNNNNKEAIVNSAMLAIAKVASSYPSLNFVVVMDKELRYDSEDESLL